MRNSKIGLAALAAVASMSLAFTAEGSGTARATPPPRRIRTSDGQRRRYRINPSGTSHYPEQSARQALRGQRRAQGGPGLIQMRDGAWVPRSIVEPA